MSILNRRGVCGWAVGFAAIFGGGHLPMGQNFTLTHSLSTFTIFSQFNLQSNLKVYPITSRKPDWNFCKTMHNEFFVVGNLEQKFWGLKIVFNHTICDISGSPDYFHTPAMQCFVIFLLIIDVIAMGRAVLEGG